MAESFVVRLTAPDRCEWVVVDAAGARAGGVVRGSLADAAGAAAGRRVVFLAPGADVVLAEPELPVRSGAKLARLVPFALEEQLAADVETLHFALGRRTADGRVPVAAVDRARLDEWLATLRAAGLAPDAAYPETLAVPANPGHVVLVLDGERLYVRRPGQLPIVLEADPPETALLVAGLPPAEPAEAAATHAIFYGLPADYERLQPTLEAVRDRLASVKVQLLPDGPLSLLAATAVNEPPFDLLQGPYTVRKGLAAEWPRWRVAAGLLGAFLALHVATLGVDWWRAREAEKVADQELRAAAAEALPDVENLQRIPNLRAFVDGRLNAARAAVDDGLLGSLGALAAATAGAPDTRVESLSYRDGVTEVTLDAPDVDSIDRLAQAVTASGFRTELQGTAQREQRYQGRLQLKGRGT